MPEALTDRQLAEHAVENMHILAPMIQKRVLLADNIKAKNRLTLTHINLLAALRREGSATMTDISNWFRIAKSNITPLVDRLIEDGYVVRKRGEKDKRVVTIQIMDKGRDVLQTVYDAAVCNLIEWTSVLDEKDRLELKEAYIKIANILEKANR